MKIFCHHEIDSDKFLRMKFAHNHFLSDKTNIFHSRGEARKMLAGGGVSLNKGKEFILTDYLLGVGEASFKASPLCLEY